MSVTPGHWSVSLAKTTSLSNGRRCLNKPSQRTIGSYVLWSSALHGCMHTSAYIHTYKKINIMNKRTLCHSAFSLGFWFLCPGKNDDMPETWPRPSVNFNIPDDRSCGNARDHFPSVLLPLPGLHLLG